MKNLSPTHDNLETIPGGNAVIPDLLQNSKPNNEDSTTNDQIKQLTPREIEVLQFVAEGKLNKQAASELYVSIKTIEKHREHLMEKLDIHDTAGLTRYAISSGIIESSVQLTIV